MTVTLWSDTNGAMYCSNHGGQYLSGAVQKSPRAKTHTTPITTWYRVTPAEAAEFAAILGRPATCEHPRCTITA